MNRKIIQWHIPKSLIISVSDIEPAPAEQTFETTDYEFAAYLVLADFDYIAQLSAVRDLLQRQKDADQLLEDKIKEADEFVRRTTGMLNERAIDDYIQHVSNSVYQDAAHSMAAVGMLAPLIESIFCQSFDGLRRKFFEPYRVSFSPDPRWQLSPRRQWDCHVVWRKDRQKPDLAAGIIQLAGAIGLSDHLPRELDATLQALFAYRNMMFHNGFEWPLVERERFQQRIAGWPSDWFSMATSGHKPWTFYMTNTFIDHCLLTIDSVLSGVGAFARQLPFP
jgi:hypothetical protein